MKFSPNRLKILLFLTACLLLKGLIPSHAAIASNEVNKISATEDKGQSQVVLFLKHRPVYNLNANNERYIILTLNDTIKSSTFEKNISEEGLLEIDEGKDPVTFKLNINLKSPFLKVDNSWLEDERCLFINILTSEGPVSPEKSSQKITSLQDVRFGFIDKGTRMVMKLCDNPSWEMDFTSPFTFMMSLNDVSYGSKREKFGPVKRLKQVNISKFNNKRTDIYLQLESPLTRVSIFRITTGNRLVLDIMDEPGAIPWERLDSPDKIHEGVVFKEDMQEDKIVIENKGNYLRVRIDNNEASVGKSSPDTIPIVNTKNETASTTPVRTEDEADYDQVDGPGLETDKSQVVEINAESPVKIKPEFDNKLPMASEIKDTIDGLNPEEAFLYGRIKQAMEIKDYEKGIILANQFLTELPSSAIIEDILFLKADFYYLLWRNGDNEVLENIISSYQKAIDRVPESKLTSLSYIKMAQAQSSRGQEYMGLGCLGLVLSQTKDKDIVPLALLTRGKIFLRINQPEKAVADFKTIMEQYDDSPYVTEANFWTASYYHSVGRHEDAEEKFNEIMDLDPEIYLEYPEYLFLRAKNCLYLKEYDIARKYLFRALNIGRQREGADMLLTRIGDTYHNQQNEDEAEKYYRMVVDYYPGTEGASISKMRIAGYSSDTAILDDLSGGDTSESISELAILEKGYQLFDKKEYPGVIETVKQLVLKPVETETRKSAKRLFYTAAEKEMSRLYQGEKYKDMTDFYNSIKDLLGDNINQDTMLSIAQAFNKLHLDEQAISTFQKIELNRLPLKSRATYYISLSESYMNNGDIPAARKLLEKARNYNLDPSNKQRISKSLAVLYADENMLDKAYTLCRSIIDGEKNLPDDELADVYILMGKIFNLQKRYGDAEMIINSTPGMPHRIKGDSLKSAYMELGKAYYHNGVYSMAIKSYEKAFDLGYDMENKDYWDLRFNLAQSYLNVGEDEEATTLLTEISEEGDTIMQQRAQIELGTIDLERQLKKLPIGKN